MTESSSSDKISKTTKFNYSLKNQIIADLICPSNFKKSFSLYVIKKLREYIISKIYYFLVYIGTKLNAFFKKNCPTGDHQDQLFIRKKAVLITGYFLQEEPAITVLILLAICFFVGTVCDLFFLNNGFLEIWLKLFLLFLTFIWLFHRTVKDIYNILVRPDYYLASKNMKFSDDEDTNNRLREILNAEAEGYQEEKKAYFRHIEKIVQKIRHLYKVNANSDMGTEFFATLAKDLKYDVKIVAKKSIGKWPTGLNAFVYNDIDIEKSDKAPEKDDRGPEKRIIVMCKFTDQDKQTMQYLLHELGHAIVGAHNVVKNGSVETRSFKINRYREALRNERDANYFAAAMLCCEYRFKKFLKDESYDLVKIMNDPEYKGLSYETIAHRAISLSDIDFHAFKVSFDEDEEIKEKRYQIIKKYTCSGLDFNHFDLEESSAGLCFQKAEKDEFNNKISIGDDLYAKISQISNKENESNTYFCFARELSQIITEKNKKPKKTRAVFVVGCAIDAAKKANLGYYERYKALNHIKD